MGIFIKMTNMAERDTHKGKIDFKPLERFLWLRRNFAYCLGLSAVIWVVGLSYYIEHFIGWSSILAIKPADFGFFILSATVPLFFVWFILAYIERSSSLDANARLFQIYIDGLMYPDEEASREAKAISTALHEQTSLLQKENKAALEQSLKLKNDLENRAEELSNILHLLDTYSAKTLTELNDGVKNLANRCTYITDKTKDSADYLKNCSSEISQNSDIFLEKLTPLLDEISTLSSGIKNNITINKENLINLKNQLVSCTDLSQKHINEMLATTDKNAKRIEQTFYKTAEEYDVLAKRLDLSVSGIEGRIEEQKRLICTQTNVLDHNSDLLGNKLSKYGSSVSEEIGKLVKNSIELEKMTKRQVSALKTINAETGKAIRGIGDVFDEKRMEIERRSEYAVNSMQNVIIAINKETEKLLSFTNLTQAKNYDLQHISETIVDKIGDMSNKLALKTDALKDKAVDVIEKFTQASELVNKQTDKMNVSSNLAVNNGKENVKLLEEQNFYINNALTNIDLLAEKLQRLQADIKKASAEADKTFTLYEKQIRQFKNIKTPYAAYDTSEPEFDQEKTIITAKAVNRFLQNTGIVIEKMFGHSDLFELWDAYLDGRQNAFIEVLNKHITFKQMQAIRKAFDDNTEFHNNVIKYLYLMDVMIKEMNNPLPTRKEELINLSVNMSLDKLYFVLIKTLNNAE